MKLSVRKGFNLKVVLDKLHGISEINDEGKVGFKGFDFTEYRRLLSQIICFPDSAKHTNTKSLVSSALKNCILTENITEQYFLQQLKLELKNKLATPERTYYVLTSINLEIMDIQTEGWKFLDCEIEFIKGDYHSKFNGREEVINDLGSNFSKNSTPLGYTRVEIKVKSRSKSEAINRGIDALNLFRALACIETNHVGFIAGDLYQAINKVRLGKVHTLHDADGKALSYPIHFEPTFKKSNLERPKDTAIFQKNIKFYAESIDNKQFSSDLENALLRYVDALDESDNNVAVTKLWGALESLVVCGQSNCDLMPDRIAARYADFELTKQIVMHIREYRNTLIHKGARDDESIFRAYNLQNFLRSLLGFYVSNSHSFTSLEEANKFLDKVSLGKEKLVSELESIQKALKYVTPEEDE